MKHQDKELMKACELIEGLSAIVNDNIEIERSMYSLGPVNCLSWYVTNVENDSQIEIIYDSTNDHDSKQGIHMTLDHNEYDLADKIDQAIDQGFNRIWLHVNLVGAK